MRAKTKLMKRVRRSGPAVGRLGNDLLSRALGHSTIGAEGFHGRVRNGIGCLAPRYYHQAVEPQVDRDDSAKSRALAHSVCPLACQMEIWRAADLGAARERFTRDQANRAIRTSQLSALRRFHTWPINVVVFHGPRARPGFEVGFPLRCVQRLSRPYIATQRCRWRDNWYTRGTSIPVLSY